MTKIAYKINSTNPNMPYGFITDHFETDQDTVPGYTVVDLSSFQGLLNANLRLLRQHEINKGVQAAPHDAPPAYQRPATDAEPIDGALMAQKQQESEQARADSLLFQEFLAWKRSQGNGS